jgi:heme-degrading monooxygenase HmoA
MESSNGFRMILFAFLILPIFTSCVVGSPFKKSFQSKDLGLSQDQKVVLVITEANIQGSVWDQILFWRNTSAVNKDLENNKGFLGGSIRRQLFGSRAWTMTVWLDDDALENFIYSDIHDEAIRQSKSALKRANFYRKEISWKEVPMNWKEAIKELESNPNYEKE